MNIWIEVTRDDKPVLGRRRRIGSRLQLPAAMANAVCATGVARKVSGSGKGEDRSAKPSEDFFSRKLREVEEASSETDAEDSEDLTDDLTDLVRGALADGRMPALVGALEALGEDPADFSNNSEREVALEAWLESEA